MLGFVGSLTEEIVRPCHNSEANRDTKAAGLAQSKLGASKSPQQRRAFF